MDLTQQDLLEELLAPRRESWSTFPSGVNEFFPNGWTFESPFYQNPEFIALNSSLLGLITPPESNFQCPLITSPESYPLILDSFTAPDNIDDTVLLPLQIQEEYNNGAMVENQEELGIISSDFHGLKEDLNSFSTNDVKVEEANSRIMGVSNVGEKKNKVKKLDGQPSKNLMAERRRRKRLNDRLSMLRSIVPKISKMDRTSILGDAIDYMKELLEKIHTLREDDNVKEEIKDIKFVGNLKELKPNEALVRKPPKFEVERRNVDTRIEICCGAKPGLLLSTVSTLEALGLDVQQCVISCFSDFSLQASCSEAREHRTILSSEDVKQTLFKTAGYGGRCL
ncbi:transcription factor bHLH93-like [Nicotiana tabacum]|uniref:Transcription factor bHLH93-like n=2 Tax=Nicotiana TaxID=4085 RepID=A0A1S3ZL91_TOBAC|nr:PREDICTED: transcription factor bHLH93-like [Nicotiana sylvestris]XP_016465310.1 PREDICTED: transcription factor bHLH93-like [Nicotiana tabacum]